MISSLFNEILIDNWTHFRSKEIMSVTSSLDLSANLQMVVGDDPLFKGRHEVHTTWLLSIVQCCSYRPNWRIFGQRPLVWPMNAGWSIGLTDSLAASHCLAWQLAASLKEIPETNKHHTREYPVRIEIGELGGWRVVCYRQWVRQIWVDGHDCTRIIVFTEVVGNWKESDQSTISEELVPIFHNLDENAQSPIHCLNDPTWCERQIKSRLFRSKNWQGNIAEIKKEEESIRCLTRLTTFAPKRNETPASFSFHSLKFSSGSDHKRSQRRPHWWKRNPTENIHRQLRSGVISYRAEVFLTIVRNICRSWDSSNLLEAMEFRWEPFSRSRSPSTTKEEKDTFTSMTTKDFLSDHSSHRKTIEALQDITLMEFEWQNEKWSLLHDWIISWCRFSRNKVNERRHWPLKKEEMKLIEP